MNDKTDISRPASQSRYYDCDGTLRAYANRAMLLAMLFATIALGSLGFAFYVRLQPPTVIRVDAGGNASVVGGRPAIPRTHTLSFVNDTPGEAGPTEIEAKAFVRNFLEHYLQYTPDSVDRQFATALNMMTANFRTFTLNKLRDDDVVANIQDDRIVSNFKIRSIDGIRGALLTYVAFGVKEIHRLRNRTETTERIVGRYNVRLVRERRSEYNPSGLLVAEFWEQQMVGERDTGLWQEGELAREASRQP